MSPARRIGLRLTMLAVIPALVAGACGSTPVRPTPAPTALPRASFARQTVVRWFVGLGKGNDANQVAAEKAFANAYNASQSGIYINLEVVPSASARETLRSEIANGTAPDIVGPIGLPAIGGLSTSFLDLSSEVTKSGYDMTRYPAAVVDLLKEGSAGQIGLPYLINPGFIFYNKTAFAKAKLPDLPKKVGDMWNGKDWTWDTLASVAALLTLDTAGKKSTDTGFDATKIAQYGMDFQWADARTMASCFASGSLLGADGKATIPDGWKAAWTWYYNAIWKTHSVPTAKVVNSPLLGNGSTVASGHVAMAVSWPWAMATYGSVDGHSPARFTSWDIAVMPSYSGLTSSPMDADTFVITRASAHPDEAFEAMVAIMGDKNLQAVYGGMPAITADQQTWFNQVDASFAPTFPGNTVSYPVLQEMENYPALPSPEVDLPNSAKVASLTAAFFAKLQSSSKVNIANEMASLQAQIQQAFVQAASNPNP